MDLGIASLILQMRSLRIGAMKRQATQKPLESPDFRLSRDRDGTPSLSLTSCVIFGKSLQLPVSVSSSMKYILY